MRTRTPTPHEIKELIAFLPELYAEGFSAVITWNGGTNEKDGAYRLPWPEYNPVVLDFFRALGSDCWLDYDYRPEEAWQMLKDEPFVRQATLDQVKTMLTFCVRGERFSDGHWAEMIEGGHIRRLLERLTELGNAQAGLSDA